MSDPEWIADVDDDAHIHMLVGELCALTTWEARLLLNRLGRDPSVPTPRTALAEPLVIHSIAYLTWVRDLCLRVDRPVDRHDLIHGAYELSVTARGSLQDRVELCVAACAAPGRDGLSANDLIALGEVSKAWLQATASLAGGRNQPQAARVLDLTAQRTAASWHLHPRRVRWLDDERAVENEIGFNVAARMRAHIDGCEPCAAMARQLRAIGVPPPTA